MLDASEHIVRLGYDVRESIDNEGVPAWNAERRSKFLIRQDVLRPLSVDRSVWKQPVKMLNEASPLYLWGSVSQALRVLGAGPSGCDRQPAVIEIAIAYAGGVPRGWMDAFEGTLHPEEDMALRLDLQEYGYDVADSYLLSGLSNCMLSDSELEGLRRTWAASLNANGLFSERSDAIEFAKVCDGLVAEHAPFFAYRIARVAGQPA